MTAQEYIDACNECDNAQRAAELLRIGVQLAEDDIRVRDIAERMKTTIERERVTIKQYAEQVERLKAEVEDLTAELEDKRIQLAELGSLSALIDRLDKSTDRSEASADRLDKLTSEMSAQAPPEPTAANKQQDKPTAVKNQLSKKADSKKPKNKDYPADFLEFWVVYPNKVDKDKAREIWQKIDPDEALKKRIIAAVKQQAKSDKWTKDGGQFVPYPSTWLRRRRWEDEQTTPTVTESGGGVHSYDVDKILEYSKKNIPKLKGDDKNEGKKSRI